MPDIAPFRGILFDPARVDVGKVLAPPYDVIDAGERARLAAGDPHNVVRLILPEAEGGTATASPGGTRDEGVGRPASERLDRYAAAAQTFEAWLRDGILRRDDRKAVYRYVQSFRHDDLGDREVTRTGFIAAVRLHDFSEGVVMPHERTLAAPKEDRLALTRATGAHLSQIFALFRDPSGDVERLFRKTDKERPVFDVRLPDGIRHALWRCNDAEMIGKLRHLMAPKKLLIADGHHRYETMLAYRDALAARAPLTPYSAANYATMFLAPVDQQGLVILPTHRVLHGVAGFAPATLLERAREYFLVDRLDGAADKPAAIRDFVAAAPQHQPAFAVVFPGDPHAYRLTLAPTVSAIGLGLATPAVSKLDVTLLHGLVLDRMLGISPAQQEAQTHLRYVKDSAGALAAVKQPGVQAVFLMGAATVDQVRHVADAGEVMPQKSTYFFPKLASGAVMNRIDPDEDLI